MVSKTHSSLSSPRFYCLPQWRQTVFDIRYLRTNTVAVHSSVQRSTSTIPILLTPRLLLTTWTLGCTVEHVKATSYLGGDGSPPEAPHYPGFPVGYKKKGPRQLARRRP